MTLDNLSPPERFEYCVNIILEHEGGLSMDKRDPGGVTQWGISLRFLRAIGLDIDGNGKIDKYDVIGLSKPASKKIYRTYWWEKYSYARFTSTEVAAKVFDLSVNMGPSGAHKLLQIAINRSSGKSLKIDGIIGINTFRAANFLDGQALRQELRECAVHKYIEILADHPNMEWCRKGWINRAAW